MMKDDNISSGFQVPNAVRIVIATICFIGGVYLLGYAFGYALSASEDAQVSSTDAGLTLAAVGGSIALGFIGYLISRPLLNLPTAKSVQTSRKVLFLSGVLGGVIGLVLTIAIISNDPDGFVDQPVEAILHQPIPAWAALLAMIAWMIVMPLISRTWLRAIDEHEAKANYIGAFAALGSYFLITPVWWLGWRGGMLPPIEPMLTFLAVTLIYTGVWAYLRYR